MADVRASSSRISCGTCVATLPPLGTEFFVATTPSSMFGLACSAAFRLRASALAFPMNRFLGAEVGVCVSSDVVILTSQWHENPSVK